MAITPVKYYLTRKMKPVYSLLLKIGVTPNMITFSGLLFALVAAIFLAAKFFALALVFVILTAVADALDGGVARSGSKITNQGAFLDSSVDRFTEFFIFIGIYLSVTDPTSRIVVLVLMGSTNLVSYLRSRAEALDLDMEGIGIIERPERLFILILAIFIRWITGSVTLFLWTISFLLLFTLITLLQRFLTGFLHLDRTHKQSVDINAQTNLDNSHI